LAFGTFALRANVIYPGNVMLNSEKTFKLIKMGDFLILF
jgi:hypothetical protein